MFVLAHCLAGLGVAQQSDEAAVVTRVREKEVCAQNLKVIYDAIQAYRHVHKDLPNWLSDLVPEYLPDANVFACPVTRRTGKVSNYGLEDPKVSTSYLYEFCARPVPAGIQGGSKWTMKQWKQHQMGLVGSVVPIVRCHQHDPVLNLAFDGRVYESPASWEAGLKDVINPADLIPSKLSEREGSQKPGSPVVAIPGREAGLPAGCVDLTMFYNAGLDEPWHEKEGSANKYANDLGWLPRGLQSFAGTPFDVRGLIQLASKELNFARYPAAVQGLPVGRAFSTIYFLHGTGWAAQAGTRIGTYLIHYADGADAETPIIYGKDVVDWCKQGGSDSKDLVVAWSGKCPATQTHGVTLRLYKSQWQNPRPEAIVESIDFVSSMAGPAPFLVAITVE